MDLVKRRDSIKRAIVLANASTKVKIGSWEGTIAEAIEHKRSIEYQQNLLESMKNQLQEARKLYESTKSALDSRLERLLQSELGKDVKTNPETLSALTNTFRANNKVDLVDPLDLATKVAELEEEISNFETNVDWVLSEANGKTTIEVPVCSSKVVVPSYKAAEY
jgi:exonuclease VII small subunit